MAADLLREPLPAHLGVGVTRDGRIFFIDDRIQTTSWLHPRTGLPVKTGHRPITDAKGWEQAVTPEGALYYIDHNTQVSSFERPVTRRPANHAPKKSSSSSPPRSPSSPTTSQPNRTPTKIRSLKAPPAKREETNMVSMKGWLYRQESGFKSWKKRWCVLADFGLFFYKDDEEKTQIGSILLPSYKISQCQPGESSKKFAFKAEHSNMRTYMFASDNQEDMNRWINALKSAAMLKGPSSPIKEPNNNSPQKLVPKSAFMEWDEDEDSPQSKKFWAEGPDIGHSHERNNKSPDNRSPGYDIRLQAVQSPQNRQRVSDNRPHREDKRSPSSPSSKPKIPLDQNMPKGMTYDPFHGYKNDHQNNRVKEQEKASPRERYNEKHRDPRTRHRENDPRSDPRTQHGENDPRSDPRTRHGENDLRSDPRTRHGENDPRSDPRTRHGENDPRSDPRTWHGENDPRSDPRTRHGENDPRSDPRTRYGENDPRSDPRTRHGENDPRSDPRTRHGENDPRSDPRRRHGENDPRSDPRTRHGETDPRSDPRPRVPSDDSRQGPGQHNRPFNSRSGIPKDSFNKYASERVQRDSRSRYPEDMERYRSRSADKNSGSRDSRPNYSDEGSSHYGPRDSRSGYSDESDPQRRSRRRDPTDGLPAIPKEQMYNPNRRHRDSDRRQERQRPKSEHLEQYNHRNGHFDNPMYNLDKQPPNDYHGAAYDGHPELIQKSQANPQDKSPSQYSDSKGDQKPQHQIQEENSVEQYDPFHGYRKYDPFHGYQQPQPEERQPEVEYSKIIKVRRGNDTVPRPDENPYMQMNSSRTGKHPDDYITHDKLQQLMTRDERVGIKTVREGDNFGQYSPQAESRQRERHHGKDNPYIRYDKGPPQETEQKFPYSQDMPSEEDSFQIRQDGEPLPLHGQYQQGYKDPEDGYSSLTKYRDKPHNAPQPQEPLRPEHHNISQYETNPDHAYHTYENIHNTHRDVTEPWNDMPNRPPLPTSVRQQIVEEIAQAKTPHTSQEILDAERHLEARMQQPAFFNYPTPTLPPTNQNQHIDPRYGHPVESVPKHYRHRDNYHDNQSYDHGRSRYPDGLPTRGQVEEDLRMLGRHDLNADPYSLQNGKVTQQHHPGTGTAQNNNPDSHLDSTKNTDNTTNSSSNLQSPDPGIMHPLESDLARRRLSPQKYSPEMNRKEQDEDREDNSNNMLNQLSALDLGKGATYENVNEGDNWDDEDIERPSAFRPLSSDRNMALRYEHGRSDEERSRPSYSDREFQDEEDETDIKKRVSVASSQLSEHSHHSYNKLTGVPMRHGGKQPPKTLPIIHTVKEDPDMPDSDILETREIPDLNQKYPALSGTRLRMSISAADLIGKTHDELVLLLIQLRREFSALEKVRNYYRTEMERKRPIEIAYRKMQQDTHQPIDPRLENEHQEYVELKFQVEEANKKIEVYKPIVNLVHNMVNMGSLYGGDNLMLASQYRKHLLSPEEYSPPKKMIEFSRKQQEHKIVHDIKEEVDHLRRDQVDLQEKLERLYELDKVLQEQSFKVTALEEDKELLEKALQGLLRQQDMVHDNPHELDHLLKQQRTVEKELSRVLYQLAEASKELEETSAENNKVEHEVALLRSKVHGELARSKSAPTLSDENMRRKMVMEKDLAKVKNIMAGLTEEGQRLSEAINTLRRSSSGGAINVMMNGDDKPKRKEKLGGTYMETDLDTSEAKDLSQVKAILSQRSLTSVPDDMNISVGTAIRPEYVDQIESQISQPLESLGFNQSDETWDISDADENTKRYFGIIPKEKPKSLTVRDVKRQSEQRREREKIRKEVDEMDSEDPAWGSSTTSPKQEDFHPIYENLPPANSLQKPWSSVIPSGGTISTTPSRRTSSVHLMGPRPFIKTNTDSSEISPSKSFSLSSGLTINDSGFVKATRVIVQPNDDSKNSFSPTSPSRSQPIVKGWSPVKTNLFNVKRTPKGRYMTISSSEPVKMETSLIQPAYLHSVAGDLMTNNNLDMVPDIVKSSTKVDQMDDAALEREILAFPEKVLIPERYMPESDEEDFTEEEQNRRQEKSEKLKKILTQQSIHSLSQPDVSNVAQEKVRRAQLLSMNQELARQVTRKSREAAAARRKTWSGSPGKIIVPDPSEMEVKEAEIIDVSKYYRQENLFI